MFSKTRRLVILPEAGPDPVVGMSQKVWRIQAMHEVDCVLDCSPGSIGSGRELSGRQRDGNELPVKIIGSGHAWGVLWDHGG